MKNRPLSTSQTKALSSNQSTLFKNNHAVLDEISPRRGLNDTIHMPISGFYHTESLPKDDTINILLTGLPDRDRTLFTKNLISELDKKPVIGMDFQRFSPSENIHFNIFDSSTLSKGIMPRERIFHLVLFFGNENEVKNSLSDFEKRGILKAGSQFFSIQYFESLKESKIQLSSKEVILKPAQKHFSFESEMAKQLGAILFAKIGETLQKKQTAASPERSTKASL